MAGSHKQTFTLKEMGSVHIVFFLYILMRIQGYSPESQRDSVHNTKCVSYYLHDNYDFWCMNPILFDSSPKCTIIETKLNQYKVPSINVSVPKFNGKTQNATISFENYNDSRLYCSWDDKELMLLRRSQTCIGPQIKSLKPAKPKSDVFFFLSPYYPVVIVNDTSALPQIEQEDNYFERLRPILPMKGSTKHITERINYASAKAGAFAIAKSKGMSGNNEVLTSNKYKYCITNCKSNKWFIFSLPEMSLIDAIATANYERFSSSVQKFVLYGSNIYPTVSWTFIGYFEAADGSSLQVFDIATPVWTRFIKFEWLSWYRNEAMCTMSEVRVYGSNMVNAMLQTDFTKNDIRSAGLKEIITEDVHDLVLEETTLEETIPPPAESEQSSPPVSPEFQPLYELYKHCEEEQTELTFSIALLSNKTKQKIHSLKTRIAIVENQTQLLFDITKEQHEMIQELEDSIQALNHLISELQTTNQSSTLWSFGGMTGMVLFWIYQRFCRKRQRRREKVIEKRLRELEMRLDEFQKGVEFLEMGVPIKKELGVSVKERNSVSKRELDGISVKKELVVPMKEEVSGFSKKELSIPIKKELTSISEKELRIPIKKERNVPDKNRTNPVQNQHPKNKPNYTPQKEKRAKK